jgi:tetratricopeptide (TPR) repeat protein
MTMAMRSHIAHITLFAAAALALAACQQMPSTGTSSVAPQVSEDALRQRANDQLAAGIKAYDAGDYDNAVKNLTDSLDHGLLSKVDQSRARKYLAFSHCVSGRDQQCRAEFRKAFEINPDFALTPAEDGHPIWGPVYRDVRTQLIAEREASVKKPLVPLGKAEQLLSDGIVKYDAAEFPAAHKLLEASLKEGLKDKADQVKAMKYLAFTMCLQDRYRDCRNEFLKIYEIEPNFDLTPAEAGHPSWTKTFAGAKAQAHKLQREKELKEAKEKAKAAPPTAGVPKK